MRKRIFSLLKPGVSLVLALCLIACGTSKENYYAPVVNLNHSVKLNNYPVKQKKSLVKQYKPLQTKRECVVRRGETLFSIAKRMGQDPQRLAILNGIHPPYKIVSGQKIVFSENHSRTFKSQGQHLTEKKGRSPNLPGKSQHLTERGQSLQGQNQHLKEKGQSIKSITGKDQHLITGKSLHLTKKDHKTENIPNNLQWRWPVLGRIIRPFQGTGKGKGIDIAGTLDKPIKAAAGGIVVYSGNGLKGYGNLIIIKHNEDFLSAYAHNRELRVKEGEQVRSGQEIALMGQTDAEQVKLHFEIRYKGKPINPLRFLPKV